MERYGYLRVSAKDQNPERQLIAMKEQGISVKNIYLDVMSGKDFARPQYQKMIKRLQKGDVLVIKSIDRLGRNYSEILEQWSRITGQISAHIEVIDMPLLNTNQFHEDLTGMLISNLVLQILAYVAETERSFIRQRQAEGIAAAKRNGTQFGRKKQEIPELFKVCYEQWKSGELSGRQAAKRLNTSHTTFFRWCKEYREEEEKNEEMCNNE